MLKYLSKVPACIWASMLSLIEDGRFLAKLLLQKFQNVPIEVIGYSAVNESTIATTEIAQHLEKSWKCFAMEWVPFRGTSFANPGVVYVDGHKNVTGKKLYQCCGNS